MNAQTTARTAGPWKLDSADPRYIRGNDKSYVACAQDNSARANAAFIVQACNAYDDLVVENELLRANLRAAVSRDPSGIHDDLVEALQAFVTQATKLAGFPELVNPYSGALVMARAALAKAGAL